MCKPYFMTCENYYKKDLFSDIPKNCNAMIGHVHFAHFGIWKNICAVYNFGKKNIYQGMKKSVLIISLEA